ncbi:hypothetical protein ATANTOWER_001740 [Ataeniobius toweri]|uniref:Uncharacterized protein n=1 Tax=Ataeniobius toweri TaxID=208326 RepID=A0ABU7CH68_9TELE|nr:hypothetical protein [Ataeniobius toweri]
MFEYPSTNSQNSLLEFWPIPPNRTGATEPVLETFLLTHIFSSTATGLRSGLCNSHSKTLNLLYSSHVATALLVCLGHCLYGRPAQALTSCLVSCCLNIST